MAAGKSKAKVTPRTGKKLSQQEQADLLHLLETRFAHNKQRHKSLEWDKVKKGLELNPDALWSLRQMEDSGGEPDVVDFDKKTNEYIFFDCSPESPTGRRSICYDQDALNARKEHKPKDSALNMAAAMKVEILNEDQYRYLQQLGAFDLKTSSWVLTPPNIRKLGGALFCDRRYDTVFTYHNGAESYYAARGFRAFVRV